jgi:hypothetical protein
MNEKEYSELLIKKAKGNHIWINAFNTINPTDEFKIGLANMILNMLNKRDNLIPASYITSDNENMQELAKLTPILYLSINKS